MTCLAHGIAARREQVAARRGHGAVDPRAESYYF